MSGVDLLALGRRRSGIGGIDQFTVSFLDFAGNDDATEVTDLAFAGVDSPRAWTFFNQAKIDADIKIRSKNTLLLDGTDDYITTPDSVDLAFGTGDFTFDFNIQRSETGTAQHNQFGQANAALSTGYHLGGLKPTTNLFRFGMNNETYNAESSVAITDTNTHHLAAVRKGNDLAVAVDGVWGSIVDITGITYTDVGAGGVFAWGQTGAYTAGSSHAGSMGQCRISNVARWTPGVNFTPPIKPYS